MVRVNFDSEATDDQRRRALYAGDLFVYSSGAVGRALCEFARGMLEEAFHPHSPPEAQYHLPVERYAGILAELKPTFIHHPESKRLIRALLSQFGCDREKTYFDVPRLRSSTSDGYLTTGIAYAFHPHRDTWYSAPQSQLNWWLPIYPVTDDEGMVFYPRYWNRAVKNGSHRYNYAEWNAQSRYVAAQQIGIDRRDQPKPEEEMDLSDDLRLQGEAGSMVVFSGAQMHASLENLSGGTRFSVDFRTVHMDEVVGGSGSPNVDSECTGTTMADYLRCRDLAQVSDDWIQRYEKGYGRPKPGVDR
jgi:hypothetical protein